MRFSLLLVVWATSSVATEPAPLKLDLISIRSARFPKAGRVFKLESVPVRSSLEAADINALIAQILSSAEL